MKVLYILIYLTDVFQDANECWTEIVRCLQQKLPAITADTQDQVNEYFE